MRVWAPLAFLITAALCSVVQADEAEQIFAFADRLRSEELHKTAIPQFEKFIKTYPNHKLIADALFRLADCHYQLKQFPQAILYYTELAGKHKDKPTYPRSLQRLGHCKLLTGDLDGCIAALTEVLKLEGIDGGLSLGTRYLLGKAYYLKQDYARGLKFLGEVSADASSENKYRGMALVMAGDASLRLSRPDEAVAAFQTALQLDPKQPERAEILLRLADAYRSKKDYAEALKHYAQVPGESLVAPAGLEGAARSLMMLGRYEEAIKQTGQLATKHPASPLVPSGLQVAGSCYYELKNYGQAAAAFEKLLNTFPQSEFAGPAAHKLCWSYYRLGAEKRGELLKCCETFAAAYPGSSLLGDIHFLRGEAHYQAKEYAPAIESYNRVPRGNPSYRAARFMIAVCHEEAGNARSALQTLEAFNREFPEAPEAADALYRAVSLSLRSRDYAGAEKKCNDYLAKYPKGKHAADVVYQKAESLRMQRKYDDMSSAFGQYLTMGGPKEKNGQAQYWIARAAQSKGDALRAQATTEKDPARAAELSKQAAESIRVALEAYGRCRAFGGETAKLSLVRTAECSYSLGGITAALAQAAFENAQKTEREKGEDAAKDLYKQAVDLQKQAKSSFNTAAEQYLGVISSEPKLVANQRAFVWTGAHFQAERQRDKAIAVFQKLVETAPGSAHADRAMHQLGVLYAEGDNPDWTRSAEWYGRLLARYGDLLKKEPRAPAPFLRHAQYGMARALRFQSKFEESAKLLEQVIANVPDGEQLSASALLELAHVQYARGRASEARDLFGRAGLLYDDNELTPEALYWAGKTTAEAGEVMEGAKLWALLCRSYPGTSWADLSRKELDKRGIVLDERGYIKE